MRCASSVVQYSRRRLPATGRAAAGAALFSSRVGSVKQGPMQSVLDRIRAYKLEEIAAARAVRPLAEVEAAARASVR